jgi:hypothetical protein
MGGTCSTHEGGEKFVEILVRKPEGKIRLRRHRWQDNTEIRTTEVRFEGVE